METKEIKIRKNKKVLAVGYKAIKYDLSTNGSTNFKYGNKGDDLIGKVFTVDEDIHACKWGLHFSKDPANVFNFYEPLAYNRYFKVQAYDEVIDTEDGLKSIARTIKFVEEYDIKEYIKIIKEYKRSTVNYSDSVHYNAVNDSNAVNYSNAVHYSNAVNDSYAVNYSNAVNYSKAVNRSIAVNYSKAVNRSNAVYYSNAVNYSNAVHYSNAVNDSNAVNYSKAVNDSYAVNHSYAVNYSDAVNDSYAVHYSNAVNDSNAVNYSYGILNCEAISKCLFCADIDSLKFGLFNKKIDESRYNEVLKNIKSFNYKPNFNNFYELKGNLEWYTVAFPDLMTVDNKTAWSKMPKKMKEYLKSLPEYDEDIFNKIIK